MSNLLTEVFFAPEEAERLRVVEKIDIARLRELASAEREGRVVVLPCKVGTPVFYIRIKCIHSDNTGYCEPSKWYALHGEKAESGCKDCPHKKEEQRIMETPFRLQFMDEKQIGHLHVSEIYFDRAEAERALATRSAEGNDGEH